MPIFLCLMIALVLAVTGPAQACEPGDKDATAAGIVDHVEKWHDKTGDRWTIYVNEPSADCPISIITNESFTKEALPASCVSGAKVTARGKITYHVVDEDDLEDEEYWILGGDILASIECR